MSHAKRKMDNLIRLKTLLYEAGGPVKLEDLYAHFPDIDRATMHRYLDDLGAAKPSYAHYELRPDAEDRRLAIAILSYGT